MLHEEASIVIDAPVEIIYTKLLDPANLPRMLRGNLADVSNVEALPTGGYRYEWMYRIAGIPIKAAAGMIECVPNQKVVVESTGGMRTVSTWVFTSEGDRTHATFSIEAPMDNPILRRLSELFIRNQLRFAVDTAVRNLKHLMEQEPSGEPSPNL